MIGFTFLKILIKIYFNLIYKKNLLLKSMVSCILRRGCITAYGMLKFYIQVYIKNGKAMNMNTLIMIYICDVYLNIE